MERKRLGIQTQPLLGVYGIKDRNRLQYPAYVHDHNLCLMEEGEIVQYLQLERLSRRKYDNRLDLFVESLFDDRLVCLPEKASIVCVNNFVANSFISQNGRFLIESTRIDTLQYLPQKADAWWQYGDWDGRSFPAYSLAHELAHIGSCLPFYGVFKDNSLLVSFDGYSSLGNFSAFHYVNGKIKLMECHNELGYLSKFFNDNPLSFFMLGANPGEHCSVPGKLMGFACYGKYDPKIEKWLASNNYFFGVWSEEQLLREVEKEFGSTTSSFDTKVSVFQDIAATFQFVFTRDFLKKLIALKEQTQAEYLYYSGGCALNIVTNSQIIEESLFKEVYIPPCCNDTGLSIGAVAYKHWLEGGEIVKVSPYLCNVGLSSDALKDVTVELIEEVARLLLKGEVIGVCNGAAEVGPRALGNRSLLALPNSRELTRKVSVDIKKREWYRPIAPIMLRKVAMTVVDGRITELSRYMLQDFKVKPSYSNQLCGVIHVNGTARIQTLSAEEENPFLFRLLTYLYEQHNVLALINTSFNRQGEPMVHTAEQAIESAKEMQLCAVVVNNKLLKV